jgi:1-acyl-sn-glycerol-3-phosphate acyltransferase
VNAWSPTSPCDPGCLPVAQGLRRAARVRRAVRLTTRSGALVAALGAGLAAAVVVPLLGPAATARVQRLWAASVLRACGIRVRLDGPVAPPGALVVANHVSWIDVLALHVVAPVRMLAKTEVRQWPLLGVMAARAGTVFLDRDRLRALPDAVAGLADALRAGSPIGLFAEGTTRCGRDLGPFRPAAFQAAHDAGAPVVPVALRYRRRDVDGLDATAAFVGDDTLASSLLRVLTAPGLVVEVTSCPVLDAAAVPAGPARASARRTLARRCAAAITAALPPAADHPAAAAVAAAITVPDVLPATPDLDHAA